MYRWYEQSAVCFVYLSDVSAQTAPDGSRIFPHFESSCWFTRGWTLQELIAPRNVEFYTSDWTYVGDKSSIVTTLSRTTDVDVGVLLGTESVHACSVAMIMSWASRRTTTRKEDIAYCLMGLFGIHMPLLYGEGERAFIRLQEEILKQSSDQSLFAWNPTREDLDPSGRYPSLCGIFAKSPLCFADTGHILQSPEYWATESTVTNRGIRLRMPFKYDTSRKSFLGGLCCISYGFDVAIEFYSPSHSLEDLDHLVRVSRRLRYERWSDDPQIHFKEVYLVTGTALSRATFMGFSGLEGFQAQYNFHVVKDDRTGMINMDESLELYPPEALFKEPHLAVSLWGGKLIGVLNPLQARYNSVAMRLPIKSLPRIALVLGFRTLDNGLANVKQPWMTMVRMDEHESLEQVWSKIKEPPSSEDGHCSAITLDSVHVLAERAKQHWFVSASRDIHISFSPVLRVQNAMEEG
ncbi:hypothetical protein L207DRAFT_512299 [Hyaloscypha variabilis F]|uniref:DUF8212 domain-containing protein n=1 Tax=Hyaloscypha variabilis (strain UAMH 11265 / GT02V1 / F) TaxID=1149755 RepID=A0A2J6RQR4_HYAVF|nr:hypothetical protein L207DRAFT_512299 [Hyaloscypha variabilis F]